MARGETGYSTLLGARLVPNVPRAVIAAWDELLAQIDSLIASSEGIETLALDALGGFERLCHEHVCRRDFNGDWGERGFSSYQKGFDVSVAEWLLLLQRLDAIRAKHGLAIILLSHARIKTVKNPLGPDYDRFVADVHDKTWSVTAKWADAVLFGNFPPVVQTDRAGAKKGKGIGGSARVLFTEHTDAYDAKNRYGMESEIAMPNDPAASWSTLESAMKGDQT